MRIEIVKAAKVAHYNALVQMFVETKGKHSAMIFNECWNEYSKKELLKAGEHVSRQNLDWMDEISVELNIENWGERRARKQSGY